jgi:hypothetical protein
MSMRPVKLVRDLSKRIVSYITITCANVPNQKQAVAGWRVAIDNRTDPSKRQCGTRQKRSTHLVLEDFKSYNESVNAYATGIRQDRLEMKPLVLTVSKSTLAVSNKRKLAALDDDSVCDGPEIYEYFEKNGTSSSHLVRNCCDSCREFALRALACLKADLVPSVAGLELVRQHKFSEREVQRN